MNTIAARTAASIWMATASVLAIGIASAQDQNQYDVKDDPWYAAGQRALADKLAQTPNTDRAKNVIVFVADGFGTSAATVTRIFEGQMRGEPGEEHFLAYERFPYSALVKTYSTDGQVADSAATASAIMTGVKTRNGKVSVSSAVGANDCATLLRGVPQTLGERASAAGMATGVITTTYVTDATPSTVYSHSPERRWNIPSLMPAEALEQGCKSISDQLIASGLNVAMGGGRSFFTPEDKTDAEGHGEFGRRKDGRDLTMEWQTGQPGSAYVWSREQLLALDLSKTERLLGLFAATDPLFEVEDGSDGTANPSVTEMTLAAIDVLSRDPDGYFLLVEHEGTDEYQHAGHARQMAEAAIALTDAVTATLAKVDLSETLIIFTSDHSQTLSFGGWPIKGNPIFGLVHGRSPGSDDVVVATAKDGKPYSAVGFYAGPRSDDGPRADLSNVDTESLDFRQQALVPAGAVPHGGDDVVAYAIGPWAHLFGGLIEQNVIFHIIDHAAGFSKRIEAQGD